ncbi:hypothetical protein IKG41_03205 [Candidatus Saccharibacteria bacterium]|nr:hypothetical protein [Candidatus Saccharibacteria bacterium]
MIDTIVLSLNSTQFRLTEEIYDKFTPNARGLFESPFYNFGGGKVICCHLNPSREDKKLGHYLPRLKLIKAIRAGGAVIDLLVEFSAPKLLFGNNFDELKDSDFSSVVSKLAKKLSDMGVITQKTDIETARALRVHFGKNVVLTNYTTASEIISELAKVNITTRRQSDTRTYKNYGETLHFFNNSNGIAIYNKKKELERSRVSEKTLIENDNYCQLSLLDLFEQHRPFEVVRIETRYNSRRAIKAILAKVGEDSDKICFNELFNIELARKILRYEFGRIAETNLGLSEAVATAPEEFIKDLNINNPETKPNQKLIALAIHELIKDTGCREIRNLIQATPTQWSRITKIIDNIVFTKHKNSAFDVISRAIEEFEPIDLESYGIKTIS